MLGQPNQICDQQGSPQEPCRVLSHACPEIVFEARRVGTRRRAMDRNPDESTISYGDAD